MFSCYGGYFYFGDTCRCVWVVGVAVVNLCTGPQVIPALVESVYIDSDLSIFLEDLLRVFVGVEGVHEDKGNICFIGFIQILQLQKYQITLIDRVCYLIYFIYVQSLK